MVGDSIDANIISEGGDSSITTYYDFTPALGKATLFLAVNSNDIGGYGSLSVSVEDIAGTVYTSFFGSQEAQFTVDAISPIKVVFSWSGTPALGESFNYDLSISEVPVPAAGFLLLGGLGALAARKRRKS